MSESSTRLSASFHVLVVGTELGGLMYAALAARAGYRVGVIGQANKPNLYRCQGYHFPRRPERLCGFDESPVVAQVFRDLSMGMEMRNLPRPVEPTIQLVLPESRLDVLSQYDGWQRELEREIPDGGRVLRRFESWAATWKRQTDDVLLSDTVFPPHGFRADARYGRAIEGCESLIERTGADGVPPLEQGGDQGRARALVEGALSHLVRVRGRPFAPLALARLWTHFRAGNYRIPGGLDGLRDLFITKLKEQCGSHRPEAVVHEIVVKRRRAVEVVLADRGERLGCDLLVANMDPLSLLDQIAAGSRIDRCHRALAAREADSWRMTINLALDPEVIPVGMGPELLLVTDPRGSLDGVDCLWVSRPGVGPFPGGEGQPGPGVLTVTVHVPTRGQLPRLAVLKETVDDVMHRLADVIPWLDDHIQVVDVPAIVTDPETGQQHVDIAELIPVMGRAIPHTLGVSGMDGATPYKNILLTGDALFGGLGFEGTCMAALQTLKMTEQVLRLKSVGRES